MTSSQTDPQTNPSPSSTPNLNLPLGVTVPPLRVTKPTSSRPTPSETTPAGGGDYEDSYTGPADPVDTSSPTEIPSSADTTISGLSLKDLARGLVLAITARIASTLSKGDNEAAELIVATEKEQAAIADPIAKIGGRHVKATAATPDIADLIVSGVAAVGYAFRVMTGIWNLKRHRAAIRTATGDPKETSTPEAAQHE